MAANIVTVTVAGEPVDVDLYTLTGTDWRDTKQATGLHDRQLVIDAVAFGDRDAVAALLWVLWRRDDPELGYDEVLAGCGYRPLDDDDGEDG